MDLNSTGTTTEGKQMSIRSVGVNAPLHDAFLTSLYYQPTMNVRVSSEGRGCFHRPMQGKIHWHALAQHLSHFPTFAQLAGKAGCFLSRVNCDRSLLPGEILALLLLSVLFPCFHVFNGSLNRGVTRRTNEFVVPEWEDWAEWSWNLLAAIVVAIRNRDKRRPLIVNGPCTFLLAVFTLRPNVSV